MWSNKTLTNATGIGAPLNFLTVRKIPGRPLGPVAGQLARISAKNVTFFDFVGVYRENAENADFCENLTFFGDFLVKIVDFGGSKNGQKMGKISEHG